MYHKILLALVTFTLLYCFTAKKIHAAPLLEDLQNNEIHLLLIYSNDKNVESEQIKKLDMLLHHFTANVKIVSDADISAHELETATHIFYYGEDKKTVDGSVRSLFQKVRSKPTIFMGENIEQLIKHDLFQQNSEVYINGVQEKLGTNNRTFLSNPLKMKEISTTSEGQVMLYGYKDTQTFPLLVQKGSDFIITVDLTDREVINILAEALHDMLPNDHTDVHVAYLRLEDIHPMSDPDRLLEIGKYLNKRNIPYILVVIPVYITPGTGDRVHFTDSPKLVEVLHYMQETGGTVISHGYTHQYRDSETGEGFEFWDVENGQFIIQSDPAHDIEQILPSSQFPSKVDYLNYIRPLKEKENDYISARLEYSIYELVSHRLYPLAFEAPHYTMSQQGYSIVGNYFSTIFGQIQLSDDNWEIMDAPPFISSGSFLNGMQLYPETIGYVNPDLSQPFLDMEKKLKQTMIVRDGVIGGFYHPYLGLEYLSELLDVYEQIPNLTWLDLKRTSNYVEADNVHLSSSELGKMHVENTLKPWDLFFERNHFTAVEMILWAVTIVVCVFLLLFFIFTLYLRIQLKKRLFKERRNLD
ncbi:DUF2334 domain-containing protein [Virgibacillus sp. W0430]|uniref:DUF2334 domain-containing protein n=1 Tax=Virgibacillus sp. W0430 TaxID=3391580 RepID=UPI003F4826BE